MCIRDRFISFPEERGGRLNLSFDDRSAQQGWSYSIEVSPSETETHLAILLRRDGTLNGFRYSDSTFSVLGPGEEGIRVTGSRVAPGERGGEE